MTTGESICMKSPNSKENRLLKVEPNIEVSDVKQKTSSDLMYCEYVDTSGSARVSKLFEKKKEKPVMVSYGESPFYKKYSDLLTELEKSKDVLPSEGDDQLPVVEMEVFIKQSIEDDSDSNDADGSKIIFCGEKDDSTTDEDTSESEKEDDTVLTKMNEKMQIISKENKLCIEHEETNNSDSSRFNSPAGESVSDKNNHSN
ncbi:uncharacterized protein [Parasteatoda tepidariorum]|uniref:uncharacterized protein n=1 Tax=Parasteatoda tepidariorum TaxID=114398 RepID=UPI001C71AD2F|nr:uncharacterized protein LOC107442475 [Parasteatoda tepidariorum]